MSFFVGIQFGIFEETDVQTTKEKNDMLDPMKFSSTEPLTRMEIFTLCIFVANMQKYDPSGDDIYRKWLAERSSKTAENLLAEIDSIQGKQQ